MKKTITIPVGKIMSVLAMGEGVCASALVDKALRMVPMNPVVKTIGRGAVSTVVSIPFSISSAFLWMTDMYDVKIGGEKDSSGKRIEDKDIEDMIKTLEDKDEAYIAIFYRGEEMLCVERISIAVRRGIISAAHGCELATKVFNAAGITADQSELDDIKEGNYKAFNKKENWDPFYRIDDMTDEELASLEISEKIRLIEKIGKAYKKGKMDADDTGAKITRVTAAIQAAVIKDEAEKSFDLPGTEKKDESMDIPSESAMTGGIV